MTIKTSTNPRYPRIKPHRGQSELAAWIHELGYCLALVRHFKTGPTGTGESERSELSVEYWEGRLARAETRVKAMADQVPG